MTDSRAQTLATLDQFLDSQRQLLARTQSDLHKLTALRERALADPQEFIENVEDELDDAAYKLSEYEGPQKPKDIDWTLFASLDPSPFATIPLPGPPPLSTTAKQRSPPSELQTFVREASARILADFKPFVPGEIEEETDVIAEAEEAADEQRLAELVKHGKNANQAPQAADMEVDEPIRPRRRVGSGLRLKPSREALDASPAVDTLSKGKSKQGARDLKQVEVPVASPAVVQERPKRSRKPRLRPDEIYQPPPPPPPPPPLPTLDLPPLPDAAFGSDIPEPIGRTPRSDSESASDIESEDAEPNAEPLPKLRAKTKAKRRDTRRQKAPSETFNLPWSLSEQHLLEKLLEEIPAGEKQRWAKISKAMAGKRTARQVASRVQKYFEKLKKFGVEPG